MQVQSRGEVTWLTRLRRDAVVSSRPDGGVTLGTQMRTVGLSAVSAGLAEALRALEKSPCTDLELTGIVTDAEGSSAAIRLQLLLRKLSLGGWLEHSLTSDDAVRATILPLGHGSGIDLNMPVPATPLKLSRFVVVRPDEGKLRAESARSALAVELSDSSGLGLLGLLASGTSLPAAIAALSELGADAVTGLFTMFAVAGLVTAADPAQDPESTERRFAQWSTADLLMHATSRSGLRNDGYGGTYRLSGRFDALPALIASTATERVVLPKPDLESIAAADPALTTVLEQRRSLRQHDDASPVTAAQLGELLYRTVRVRRTGRSGDEDIVDKAVPAGGSLHELEVYPVVNNCEGLRAGIWHYDSAGHAFDWVCDPSPAMRELVEHSKAASLMDTDPQVLLVIAARFGRVMRKYESMAYALILKHVGVVYQSLYLVATAMGLAPCAQGGGSATLFAAASGIDYYSEGSVGEFIVGSTSGEARSMWEMAGA